MTVTKLARRLTHALVCRHGRTQCHDRPVPRRLPPIQAGRAPCAEIPAGFRSVRSRFGVGTMRDKRAKGAVPPVDVLRGAPPGSRCDQGAAHAGIGYPQRPGNRASSDRNSAGVSLEKPLPGFGPSSPHRRSRRRRRGLTEAYGADCLALREHSRCFGRFELRPTRPLGRGGLALKPCPRHGPEGRVWGDKPPPFVLLCLDNLDPGSDRLLDGARPCWAASRATAAFSRTFDRRSRGRLGRCRRAG